MVIALVLPILWSFSSAAASLPVQIPAIGEHYPVFQFEKNENRQNVMVAYVKLSSSCEIARDPSDPSRPLFDFYWLMDGLRYKPVHRLIKKGIRERLVLQAHSSNSRRFAVQLNDLKDLNPGWVGREIVISSRREGTNCVVAAVFDQTISITKIYCEAQKSFLPPFRKIQAVTLVGWNSFTGRPVERRFVARSGANASR